MNDPVWALDAGVRLAAVASMLSALELLSRPQALRPGGLLDWRNLRLATQGRPRWDRLLRCPAFFLLLAVEAAGSLVVVLGVTWAPLVLTVGLLHRAHMVRHRWSVDGADRMVVMVMLSTGVALLLGTEDAARTAILFLAAQASLAYLTSGISKAQCGMWRSGSAAANIMSTRMFGDRPVGRFLSIRPALSLALSWAVMGVELGLGFTLLLPSAVVPTLLLAGALFHLGCARLLGLNTFFWAFLATYPALLAARQLGGPLPTPLVVAAAGLAFVAAILVSLRRLLAVPRRPAATTA